jgi:hypothetical protein
METKRALNRSVDRHRFQTRAVDAPDGSAPSGRAAPRRGANRAGFRKSPPQKVLHFGSIVDPPRAFARRRSAASEGSNVAAPRRAGPRPQPRLAHVGQNRAWYSPAIASALTGCRRVVTRARWRRNSARSTARRAASAANSMRGYFAERPRSEAVVHGQLDPSEYACQLQSKIPHSSG